MKGPFADELRGAAVHLSATGAARITLQESNSSEETVSRVSNSAAVELRRRRGDSLSGTNRLSLVAAIFIGALIGSRLLAWFDNPAAQSLGISGLMYGRTLVGGLVGGWMATEVEKRRIGIRQPTGDLYVYPVIAALRSGGSDVFCPDFPMEPMARPQRCDGASTSATVLRVIRRRSDKGGEV
jgi:hypothetical protein